MSLVKSQQSSALRFQEALKEFNSIRDDAQVKGERLRYVHEASRLLILDAYLRGELALLCDVKAARKVDAIGGSLEPSKSESVVSLTSFVLHLNSINMARSQHGNKKPVFVSVVEIVNGPDGVIPSLARLYRVNHKSEEIRAGFVYFSMLQKTLYLFDALADGELCPIVNEGGSELCNCAQPSIVEGAFEIVDSISNHKSEIIEGCDITKRVGESLSSVLRVNLNNGGISFVKRGDAPFDIGDMLIGPLNFDSSIGELHAR